MGIRPAQESELPTKVHTEEPENSLEVLESILGGGGWRWLIIEKMILAAETLGKIIITIFCIVLFVVFLLLFFYFYLLCFHLKYLIYFIFVFLFLP